MHMLMHGHGEQRGRGFIISHMRLDQCAGQDDTRDVSITTNYFTSEEVSLNNHFLCP
jgi:hypothetical protein